MNKQQQQNLQQLEVISFLQTRPQFPLKRCQNPPLEDKNYPWLTTKKLDEKMFIKYFKYYKNVRCQ